MLLESWMRWDGCAQVGGNRKQGRESNRPFIKIYKERENDNKHSAPLRKKTLTFSRLTVRNTCGQAGGVIDNKWPGQTDVRRQRESEESFREWNACTANGCSLFLLCHVPRSVFGNGNCCSSPMILNEEAAQNCKFRLRKTHKPGKKLEGWCLEACFCVENSDCGTWQNTHN